MHLRGRWQSPGKSARTAQCRPAAFWRAPAGMSVARPRRCTSRERDNLRPLRSADRRPQLTRQSWLLAYPICSALGRGPAGAAAVHNWAFCQSSGGPVHAGPRALASLIGWLVHCADCRCPAGGCRPRVRCPAHIGRVQLSCGHRMRSAAPNLRRGARLGSGRAGLAGWPCWGYRSAARSETRPAIARKVSSKSSRRPR